ncbi:addiction module toxin RelE [Candidatus Micrarchaeota archaeon]|nr:addiction module toxin RelE [Candidatus Micrarchaeota archaeon]
MAPQYAFSDKLKAIIQKLRSSDPQRLERIYKKINQIIESDETTIEHYKNLKNPMNRLKRVHIDSSFVLTFHYDKAKKFILFVDFDHHDNIYRN